MKLITAGASPFARKVRVLLMETGQMGDVEMVDVTTAPTNTNDEVAAANPLGKLPALLREDGPAIYDSRVICRYLTARAGADLYPETRLWETLTLEATADGIMDAAILLVYESRVRAAENRDQGWVDAQWTKIDRAVSALNTRWMSHLAGPLDMGQIAVGCALTYLDFRHGDRDWRPGNDALAEWHQEFDARAAMAATLPVG